MRRAATGSASTGSASTGSASTGSAFTGSAFTVGFVLFVAIGVLIVALFVVGGDKGVFLDRKRYVAYLPTTSGLIEGSKVYLSGVPVGSVARIDFADDLEVNRVRVTLAIATRFASRVRSDSVMWLATEGLLGDYAAHISMGTANREQLAPGSEIPFEERTMLEGMAGTELTSNTAVLMQTMIGILKQIQSGQGTLGQLLKNPELYENLNALAASLQKISVDVEVLTRDARELLGDVRSDDSFFGRILVSPDSARRAEQLLRDASESAAALKQIVTRVRDGHGTAGQLLQDVELHDRIVAAVAELERLGRSASETFELATSRESVVGLALRDEAIGRSFESILTEVEEGSRSLVRVLRLLEDGEGSAGVLLHDPSIAISLRNLFIGVQDLGYVRGLVNSAEAVGQEIARGDRLDRSALDETGAIGRAVQGTARDEESTVPVTGPTTKEEGK